MGKLRNYGLSLTLFVLFALSWAGQLWAQRVEVAAEAAQHAQVFSWADFWPAFAAATLENWQSEFLQLFSFVVLATYLIHQGSPQSRDGDDEQRRQLAEALERLARIESRLQP